MSEASQTPALLPRRSASRCEVTLSETDANPHVLPAATCALPVRCSPWSFERSHCVSSTHDGPSSGCAVKLVVMAAAGVSPNARGRIGLARGFTVGQVAWRLGVSPAEYLQLEDGERYRPVGSKCASSSAGRRRSSPVLGGRAETRRGMS
jgi:hypothetical protein